MKLHNFLILLAFIFFTTSINAEQKFPFKAKIRDNSVNIRAGYNENFESLAKLNSGDEVIVVDKEYSWYKIRLPENAPCFVNPNHIARTEEGKKGRVIANHLKVRAKPSLKATSIGQLKKGEILEIKGKKNGWYQFVPTENCFGLVKEEYLEFSSEIKENQNLAE